MTDTRWLLVHDALLRGLSHALSNRIATLSASAYMLEHGDVSIAQAVVSLREETERMDTLLQLLRLLPGSEEDAREAVSVRETLEQAVALHAHHLDVRDVEVFCEVDDDVPPVWVEPHRLLRDILLRLDRAKHDAFAAAATVTAALSGTADRVQLHAGVTNAPPTDDHGDNSALTWPSLAAARRAER